MKHFDDRALSALVAEELDEAETREFSAHIQECAQCARRVEGWRDLFPQVERLEVPDQVLTPPPPVFRLPSGSAIIMPDREDDLGLRRRLHVMHWVVGVLALAMLGLLAVNYGDIVVGWVRGDRGFDPGVFTGPIPTSSLPTIDSTASGAALPPVALPPPQVAAAPTADTTSKATRPPVRPSPSPAATPQKPNPHPPVRPDAKPQPAARDSIATKPPPSAPVRPSITPADTARSQPQVPAPAPTNGFTPVTLDVATARLHGTIREIPGLRRLGIEAGPGSLAAGAHADLDLIRIRYLGLDSTTVVLEEQRLPPGEAAGNPEVVVTPLSDGQLMARWIDGERVWLSIVARGDGAWLLQLVNSVR